MTVGQLLISLILIFAAAKLFGELAERIGQPAVLGEMAGGLVLGVSGLHLIDPHQNALHLFAELGVILLLFLIGLETDFDKLMSVGVTATLVAIVGVAVPFAGGFLVGRMLGLDDLVAIYIGAALTATSVGITARLFSDLGHLHDKESQIVLGAAVVDDVIGLVILAVVSAMAGGQTLSLAGITRVTGVAFGFVIGAIVLGSLLAPFFIRVIARLRVTKALFFGSVVFAFALAFTAEKIGSAMIVGAFAAGLVLSRTEKGKEIEREVHDIAQFFIPIFFVIVGATIDLRTLNPFDPATRTTFLIGLLLTIVGIVGKMASALVAWRQPVRKIIIGVGMIPRGEVGLIFAQIGLTAGILTSGLYSSVAMLVIVTTFMTPPLLRMLLGPRKVAGEPKEHYVIDAFKDEPPEDPVRSETSVA